MVSRYGINEGLGYIEKLRAKPKRCTALNKLTLSRSNEDVQRVLVKQGEHVGNLKLFSGYESSRLSVTTRKKWFGKSEQRDKWKLSLF